MSELNCVCLSHSVVSDSLRLHGLQNARPPCPSPTPRAYSNSCLSVMPSNHLILCRPLLLPPSVFPSIRVFSTESVLHIRWPKYWSFSFSASVLPANIPDCLPLGLTGLIALCPRDSQEFSPTPQCISINSFFMVQLSHPYMTTGKTIALTIRTFVGNVSAF